MLQHGDNAQQSFSSDKATTLHLAIPALEALYKAWSSRAKRPKYDRFGPALHAACIKIDDYYERTTESPAYILAMILDPREKLSYFKKHWSPDLLEDVVKCVEGVFKTRYLSLHATNPSGYPSGLGVSSKQSKSKITTLLRELSDDEDNVEIESPGLTSTPEDPNRPWLHDFHAYLDIIEHIPDGWTIVGWWGFNAHRYPVWASLARDYTSIMASSVSSERAFSQGGLTITKRRSRLKGDIVEALQCIKCGIRQDLLFRDAPPSSAMETTLNQVEEDDSEMIEGWDELLIDEE